MYKCVCVFFCWCWMRNFRNSQFCSLNFLYFSWIIVLYNQISVANPLCVHFFELFFFILHANFSERNICPSVCVYDFLVREFGVFSFVFCVPLLIRSTYVNSRMKWQKCFFFRLKLTNDTVKNKLRNLHTNTLCVGTARYNGFVKWLSRQPEAVLDRRWLAHLNENIVLRFLRIYLWFDLQYVAPDSAYGEKTLFFCHYFIWLLLLCFGFYYSLSCFWCFFSLVFRQFFVISVKPAYGLCSNPNKNS